MLPSANGSELAGRPVVVCVSRLVPRKGQDTLIRAWPQVRAAVPDAALLLVGGGPYAGRLQRLAGRLGVAGSVIFTGPVPWSELPSYYDAGDVFAMPCRTRRHGLDVEGLGIVYLEASATGLPVIGGDSGNAPDAIRDGETGYVVAGAAPRTSLTGWCTCSPTRPAPGPWGRRGWPGWTRNGGGTWSRGGCRRSWPAERCRGAGRAASLRRLTASRAGAAGQE